MALVQIDGFEHFTNQTPADLAGRWAYGGTSTFFGRVTTGLRNGHGAAISLSNGSAYIATSKGGNLTTIYVAFALKLNSSLTSNAQFLRFADSGSIQVDVQLTTGGVLRILRSGFTELGTGSYVYTVGNWTHYAFKMVVDNTTGSFEARVNGSATPDVNLTNIDTQATGNAWVNDVRLYGVGQVFNFDDFVLADDTGSQAFLGDYDVYSIFPDGAGASAQFTPSAGSNWQNVDENPNDGDTTYNESQTLGHKDRFTMGNVPADTDTVYGVQVGAFAKKTTISAREVNVLAYDGTTEGAGSDQALNTVYEWNVHMFEDHPTSAAPWTESEVNSMEAGYEVAV